MQEIEKVLGQCEEVIKHLHNAAAMWIKFPIPIFLQERRKWQKAGKII